VTKELFFVIYHKYENQFPQTIIRWHKEIR
jgi:hypothetical protein